MTAPHPDPPPLRGGGKKAALTPPPAPPVALPSPRGAGRGTKESLRDTQVRGVVPSTYVRLLFDYLEKRGVDAAALLKEKPPEGADKGLGRYPVARWRELLERAAKKLDDPLLGLHLGRSITPAHLGVMGYVLLNCGSFGAALARMQKFERLIYDVNPLRHSLSGASVLLEWGVEHGRPGALVDETALTALIQFSRGLAGKNLPIEETWFVNAEPADTRPYREFFGGAVKFNQAVSRLRFPARYLALPLRQPDPALLAVLEQQAQSLHAGLPRQDDFQQAVRSCIARLTREGEPSLERVADELHISTRTLHRRLKELDCNFRELLEDTRRRMAEGYLRDPRLQLAEIAQLLGFSEQSAFNRAFRRWTAESPGSYRRHALA